jgi:hypothetical protein
MVKLKRAAIDPSAGALKQVLAVGAFPWNGTRKKMREGLGGERPFHSAGRKLESMHQSSLVSGLGENVS